MACTTPMCNRHVYLPYLGRLDSLLSLTTLEASNGRNAGSLRARIYLGVERELNVLKYVLTLVRTILLEPHCALHITAKEEERLAVPCSVLAFTSCLYLRGLLSIHSAGVHVYGRTAGL